jgi:hypothetical protein
MVTAHDSHLMEMAHLHGNLAKGFEQSSPPIAHNGVCLAMALVQLCHCGLKKPKPNKCVFTAALVFRLQNGSCRGKSVFKGPFCLFHRAG